MAIVTHSQNSHHQRHANINPLKRSGIRWLHFEVLSTIQVSPTFLISDIQTLWCSGLSARVPNVRN